MAMIKILILFLFVTATMLYVISEFISTLLSETFDYRHKKSHFIILGLFLIIPLNVMMILVDTKIMLMALRGGLWIPTIMYCITVFYLSVHLRQERKGTTDDAIGLKGLVELFLKKIKQLITLNFK